MYPNKDKDHLTRTETITSVRTTSMIDNLNFKIENGPHPKKSIVAMTKEGKWTTSKKIFRFRDPKNLNHQQISLIINSTLKSDMINKKLHNKNIEVNLTPFKKPNIPFQSLKNGKHGRIKKRQKFGRIIIFSSPDLHEAIVQLPTNCALDKPVGFKKDDSLCLLIH